MKKITDFISFIATNFQKILASVIGVLVAIMGIAALIPGDEPEKTLQAIVDFLTQFSVK